MTVGPGHQIRHRGGIGRGGCGSVLIDEDGDSDTDDNGYEERPRELGWSGHTFNVEAMSAGMRIGLIRPGVAFGVAPGMYEPDVCSQSSWVRATSGSDSVSGSEESLAFPLGADHRDSGQTVSRAVTSAASRALRRIGGVPMVLVKQLMLLVGGRALGF